jgi:hypothetical protein
LYRSQSSSAARYSPGTDADAEMQLRVDYRRIGWMEIAAVRHHMPAALPLSFGYAKAS